MSALTNKIGKSYVLISTGISVAIVLGILSVLIFNSWPALQSEGWQLFTLHWNPTEGDFGILSMLYGSIVVTCIALGFAVPLGILTAIFTSEYLPKPYRFALKSVLELLAGIPSIIYGLIGISIVSLWVQQSFDLQSGRTLLTAGLILAVMILPTVITLCDEALHSVPNLYREASMGLGLYKFEVINNTLLPIAKNNIIGAVLLALGRAMGETMAVMLLIGSIDKIPSPFFNWLSPGQSITSKLGREIAETAFGSVHFSALIFMGLFLIAVVISLTLIAQRSFKHQIRLNE